MCEEALEAAMLERKMLEDAFDAYDQIKENQTNDRKSPLIEAWNKGRAAMGFNPVPDKEHVCSIECRLQYIDTICPQLRLYGCRLSGATHVCNGLANPCDISYTDREGYHFCTFSGRGLGKTVVYHKWSNPNANRPGFVNCFTPVQNKHSKPSSRRIDEENKNSLASPGINLAASTPRRLSTPGTGMTPSRISMGSPLRTPLSLDGDSGSSVRLKTPFDAVGSVGGGSPRTPSEASTPFGSPGGGGPFDDGGLQIATTPRRPTSGLGLHSTLSKSVPDYTLKTIKGKKRKSGRKRKANNPKRDVKRNDWALDVKRRALVHLKTSVHSGNDPARDRTRSEWDDDDDDEEPSVNFRKGDFPEFISDTYNGVCLFTVAIPLYRGYSHDIILENPYKKGRRSRYAWLGGNFQIKHNSEIETRTDDILQDLLWDNKIKMEIYEQKLTLAKQQTLTKIEMYVASCLDNTPPRFPNYNVMRTHWLHTINDSVKEPACEELDPCKKTFYRLLTLTLWAFMWEYIEVPAWRKRCFERIRKLETTHVGVISPSQTNIPVQPGVSHIQFTTGLLYVLKQDGMRLGNDCVMPPDEWLQQMLPSTAELDYDLMTVSMKARETSASKSKKTQASLRRKVTTGRGRGANLPKRRRRRKKKVKKNQRNPESYGRGKRSYTQSNVTDGRNYTKKGLLKLSLLGHTENIKKAVEMCRQQSKDIYKV